MISSVNKVILLEPALFDFYILLFFKFAKRQVGPIKRQSSQYCFLIGHALNQSHTPLIALQSRGIYPRGTSLRWDVWMFFSIIETGPCDWRWFWLGTFFGPSTILTLWPTVSQITTCPSFTVISNTDNDSLFLKQQFLLMCYTQVRYF